MDIIKRYILKESIMPFIMSLFILTCVFLLGNLIKLTNLVINKGVSISVMGKVFLLYIPVLLGYTLPIACLISVIITFSRLSNDNEILALRASGVRLQKLLTPLIVIGIMFSFLSVLLNERIIPYAFYKQRRLLKNLGMSNPTALLEPGMFIKAFENQILFIHKIDDNKMYNITIYQPQPNGPTRTIIAKKGEFSPVPGKQQIKLKLIDGTSDEPNFNKDNSFYKLHFKQYFMTLDFSKKSNKMEKKPKGMTLKELKEEIHKNEKLLVDTYPLETEYFRKITWSFSPLFFILLGFPIAVISHRREKSANVVLAILCAASYYVISVACESLSIKNVAPPILLMWIPNIIAGITALILNLRCVY